MEAEPTRIMIAVNESNVKGYPHASRNSGEAFVWTLEKIIRSNTTGFKILLLHVQNPEEDAFDDMDHTYALPKDFKRMKHKDRVRGLHLLEYFVQQCHDIGIACEAWIKQGDPMKVICNEVLRIRPSPHLLVVGSRDLTAMLSMFMGSVSNYCVKHAACPVMRIKRLNDDEDLPYPLDD